MKKHTSPSNWRGHPDVIRLATERDQAREEVAKFETRISTLAAEAQAAEDERSQAATAVAAGKEAPSALVAARSSEMRLRKELQVLEETGPAVFERLRLSEEAYDAAAAEAQVVAWQAGFAAYLDAVGASKEAMKVAVQAEERLQEARRALTGQFDDSFGWVSGPGGLKVGNAAWGIRALSTANLKLWLAHIESVNVLPEAELAAVMTKRAAEAMARERVIEERKGRERKRALEERAAGLWMWTRDLSPSRIVNVGMRKGG